MARQLGYGGGVAVRRRVNVGRGVALVLQARRQKLVDSECGCGGGRHASVAPSVAVMTAAGTSKVEARRRAREATRRANEARAAREKANIENAANYMVAKARLAEIDAWETERLAAVTELVRAEATKRRAGTRAAAGAAIRLLRVPKQFSQARSLTGSRSHCPSTRNLYSYCPGGTITVFSQTPLAFFFIGCRALSH